jgi:hypothetical protein
LISRSIPLRKGPNLRQGNRIEISSVQAEFDRQKAPSGSSPPGRLRVCWQSFQSALSAGFAEGLHPTRTGEAGGCVRRSKQSAKSG